MQRIFRANQNFFILVLCIVLLLINHFAAFHGHFGYDDLMYARLAANLLDGKLLLDDYHFAYRWTILFLTSFSYYILGITDFASAIPSLIVSILTMTIVYKICKHRSTGIFLFILLLFFLNPWSLYYSDKLMPDIYVALASIGLIAIMYFHRYKNNNKKDVFYAIGFSLFVMFGVVSKAAIVLIMPVCLFVLISDVIQKKYIRFWVFSCLIMVAMIVLYLLLIKGLTGNYLQRIIAINTSNFYNISSYEKRSYFDLIERITVGLPKLFIREHMIIGLIFSIPAIFSMNIRRLLSIRDEAAFFSIITLLAYLSANFMSTSFRHYIPMHNDPRHYLFLIPIAAITGGPVIHGFLMSKKHGKLIVVLSAILVGGSFTVNGNDVMNTYIPLFLIVLLRYLVPIKISSLQSKIVAGLFIVIIIIKPASLFLSDADSNYDNQKEIIQNHIIGKKEDCITITNPVQKHLGEYYLGFKNKGVPLFLSYEQAKDFQFNATHNIFLLTNPQTRGLSAMNYYQLPLYARKISKNYITLDSKGSVALFGIGDTNELIEEVRIIYDKNDFETSCSAKFSSVDSIVKAISYSGQNANLVTAKGYSSTYLLNLDELYEPGFFYTHIVAEIKLYDEKNVNAQFVVSVEQNGNQLSRESYPTMSFLPIDKGWKQGTIHHQIEQPVDKETIIKIYMWNTSNENIVVDDFVVELYKDPRSKTIQN